MAQQFGVIGLGTFGYTLAVELTQDGGEVVVVDKDKDVIQRVSPVVARAVCADVLDLALLDELGFARLPVVILAMPHHFDVSVLTVRFLAKRKVPRIVAQVSSDIESDALRAVGATDIVFPEEDIAYRVAAGLLVPGLADAVPTGSGTAIAKIACPDDWVGRDLKHLDLRRRHRVNVVAVFKPHSPEGVSADMDPIPAADRVFERDDLLFVFGRLKDLVALGAARLRAP